MWMMLALLGCGEQVAPEVEEVLPGDVLVTPATLDFGAVAVHEEATASVVISNVGEGDLYIYDVQFADDTRRPHWRLSGGRSGRLSSGESIELEVVFHPMDLSDADVTLLIPSDDPDEPQVTVILKGEALGVPALRVEPSQLDFGEVAIGDSARQSITIANDGSADLEIIAVGMANASEHYTVVLDPTGSDVQPLQDDGRVMIDFAPQATGTLTNSITLTTSDPERPSVSVVLTGQGISE